MTVTEGTRLYKIVGVDGSPIHGGYGAAWPLPTNGQPADWMRVEGALVLCQRGLHVTDKPIDWWKPGARLFDVEIAPDAATVGQLDNGHKIAVSAARLVKEADWGEHCVWLDGEHEIGEGFAFASGSATVEAYGSATVRAYGSATVEAYGSATVRAYDSATVEAYGSATVEAYDSATVRASGSATVRAYGSATVEAYGSATVEAYDSATVEAYDSANVISTIYHSPAAQVALADLAAHIDRRERKVELRKVTA